jgi:hypothetical protein
VNFGVIPVDHLAVVPDLLGFVQCHSGAPSLAARLVFVMVNKV